MKVELYTLKKDDVECFSSSLPKDVYENTDKDGFFAIGAVGTREKQSVPVGIIQFHTNITSDEQFFVEITYLYIAEDYRRDGIGSTLIDSVRNINKNSAVDILTALIPTEDINENNMDITVKEFGEFFDMQGFSKEDVNLKMYSSVVTDVYPNINETNFVRYTKLLQL
ncbi:MAG: GNAT family N-acetyltransferase [Lachnospiraceae bacterium]|nr:GNAT family N-acetyltransferase [Lachnospiraceae bacterium]